MHNTVKNTLSNTIRFCGDIYVHQAIISDYINFLFTKCTFDNKNIAYRKNATKKNNIFPI